LFNIYAPCDVSRQQHLWNHLSLRLGVLSSQNVCVCGDFNAVRCFEERRSVGRVYNAVRSDNFNNLIDTIAPIDLPLQGDGKSMSRIDRFLLSEKWCLIWPNCSQLALTRGMSDHCPLVLAIDVENWGPRPLRMLKCWESLPGYNDFVRDKWLSFQIEGWGGYVLKEKLKLLKLALKDWHQHHSQNIPARISTLKGKIATLDLKGETEVLREEEVDALHDFTDELFSLSRIHSSICLKQSRINWIREGDANTKFFHGIMSNRRRRNSISFFLVNGAVVEGVPNVRNAVFNHCSSHFQTRHAYRPSLDDMNFRMLNCRDRAVLIKPFSLDEVKAAVWDCDNFKCPGLDGVNLGFIKSFWDIVKLDVLRFLSEFHRNGRLAKGINNTFIALIPKVDSPQRLNDFRPISLVGSMYKILAKVLANRLRYVIDSVVSDTQSAFIKGRQILDGILIANEIVDEAHRGKKELILFKVDFEKAYDSIDLGYLDEVMGKMGFPALWRKWIKECIGTATASVLVNGSPTDEFSLGRGLRQGDPLSPFLFLLAAEGFNVLMESLLANNLFSGYQVGDSNMAVVSHLQFADDTLILGEKS